LKYRPGAVAGPFRRQLLIGSGTLAALVASALVILRQRPEASPAVLFTLPPFELQDEQGRPFGSSELKGRIYVADFIYTGCTDSCPLLTARMGEIQDALSRAGPEIHLVSFSVDPDRDTPAKLLDYAKRARYDPARWSFLTGNYAAVRDLLNDGFKVAMYREVHDGGATPEELIHDEHLVLVDTRGRLRGYFAADRDGLASLRRGVKYLATHSP
jgi:protein SCO1/2